MKITLDLPDIDDDTVGIEPGDVPTTENFVRVGQLAFSAAWDAWNGKPLNASCRKLLLLAILWYAHILRGTTPSARPNLRIVQ